MTTGMRPVEAKRSTVPVFWYEERARHIDGVLKKRIHKNASGEETFIPVLVLGETTPVKESDKTAETDDAYLAFFTGKGISLVKRRGRRPF